MGRALRFTLIGCGGLVGLFLLLGIVGALIGGGDTQAPEQAQEQNNPQPKNDAASKDQQEELEKALEEAEEAKQEAEAAKEEAAQAKREAEEAEAARAEAEDKPKPAPEEGDTDTVTIRVTGTAGERFSGSYGNIDTTRTVDGTIPASFKQEVDTGFLAMDTVTAVFQKMRGGQGELRVEIVYDGEVVKSQNTTAAYGLVTVNWVPGE